MADIDVQRKSGSSWLWWLLGLIVLALIIWALVSAFDRDEPEVATMAPAVAPAVVTEPTATGTAPVGAATTVPATTIAEVKANPTQYEGQSFATGPVQVASVVSDRGFWVESNGQRLFVVKDESPAPGTADVQGAADTRPARSVNAGDQLQINGTLHTAADQVQPPLDAQTKQALQSEPIFLQANVTDIQHMGA